LVFTLDTHRSLKRRSCLVTTSAKDDDGRKSFYTSPPEEWFELGLERLRAVARENPEQAREIIDERRAEILRLLDCEASLDETICSGLAQRFSCSEATIQKEIKLLRQLRVMADWRSDTNQGQSLD
jgi:hypothetical protein